LSCGRELEAVESIATAVATVVNTWIDLRTKELARRAPLQSAGSSAASKERSSRDWSVMRDVLHWEK
jgi:hypothetical protein